MKPEAPSPTTSPLHFVPLRPRCTFAIAQGVEQALNGSALAEPRPKLCLSAKLRLIAYVQQNAETRKCYKL